MSHIAVWWHSTIKTRCDPDYQPNHPLYGSIFVIMVFADFFVLKRHQTFTDLVLIRSLVECHKKYTNRVTSTVHARSGEIGESAIRWFLRYWQVLFTVITFCVFHRGFVSIPRSLIQSYLLTRFHALIYSHSLTHLHAHWIIPRNTGHNSNVFITSKRRHFDVITSKWRRFWRNNDVIIAWCVCWDLFTKPTW